MTDTRIDAPRNGEPRAAKLAQHMSSVRSAGAAGEETQGFSALLASLDGLSGLVAGSVAAADTQEDKPALTSLAQEDALLAAQACAFAFVRRQGQPFFAHAPLPHRTGRPPTLYCSVISRVI